MGSGRKTALHYARKRTEEILQTHKAPPLNDDADRALDEILREAEDYFKNRGMF
jgi:trimethylamine:corrinoid methyltransferase-like protein